MLLLILFQIFVLTQGNDVTQNLQINGNTDQVPTTTEKVKFQFYYETLCPHSVREYIDYLEDAVKDLAPYLDISTHPYGKAEMYLNGTQLTIECHHGENECSGNTFHACAIEVLKEPTKYVPFNACMMRRALDSEVVSYSDDADACGAQLNVNATEIKHCSYSIRGFQLLLHHGLESRKVYYRGVPSWYVNGVYKHAKGTETRHVKEILCAAFTNPPEACK